ncbi:peptidyl-prolyl cis-trans isomerase FKBP8-like isoform X3 [Sinocyclocheilus anshuiensis]|uniref:peptidyl-prolyl cis-trans isomerase FKBP8-like isoform X3 n=1 Tax=Sinocyclocheilus anshuiensis TaxID=1608454 RepID=UPI0007B9258A|nr:PREDICTED: peptidyl-prolyl cis-trans isomerase FKBP8-like isoform X3 [Sinocyclocheilus anshuiensis]
MVSLAQCGDMEPEAEEAEETTLESEMFVNTVSDKQEVKSEEAILQPWQAFQEPSMELQRMNITGKEDGKKTVEVKEDDEGSEAKNETDNKVAEEMMCAENLSNMPTDANDSSSDPTNEHISSNSHTSPPETNESDTGDSRKLTKTPSFGKTVRFKEIEAVEERDSSVDTLFSDFEIEEWTTTSFEELFLADDWKDIADERLIRKKVLQASPENALTPAWGQEVTLKMQGVLEDRTVVEKDCKLVFVIGEGDVNQALEECTISMKQGEIALLLADSQYTYGHLGREPDIPAWAPLLYQLQLLDFREKPDPLSLPIPDRIRIGNQKRERGNFYFQSEEYSMAAQAYCMALDVLTTHTTDSQRCASDEEDEEVNDYQVKCLNNLAAAQLKLGQSDEALHTSRDVLFLDPQNVKALFRKGKAIHAELSKLVKRQAGQNETQNWQAKPAQVLGENIAPFLTPPPEKKQFGISWKFLLGALVVALGSLVTSVVLSARN